MIENKQLSENFTLYEYLASGTAKKMGYSEQWSPTQRVVKNIEHTNEWLQKVRDKFGSPILINSGYRCERLNKAVKGHKNSWHMSGQAVDIVASNGDNLDLWNTIVEMGGYHKIIWYYEGDLKPRFIHITLREEKYNSENKDEIKIYSVKNDGYIDFYEPDVEPKSEEELNKKKVENRTRNKGCFGMIIDLIFGIFKKQ